MSSTLDEPGLDRVCFLPTWRDGLLAPFAATHPPLDEEYGDHFVYTDLFAFHHRPANHLAWTRGCYAHDDVYFPIKSLGVGDGRTVAVPAAPVAWLRQVRQVSVGVFGFAGFGRRWA